MRPGRACLIGFVLGLEEAEGFAGVRVPSASLPSTALRAGGINSAREDSGEILAAEVAAESGLWRLRPHAFRRVGKDGAPLKPKLLSTITW